MKIKYLIRSVSSGKYYFSTNIGGSFKEYFIPDGSLANNFNSYEDAEDKLLEAGLTGMFEIVEVIIKER